MSNPVTTTHRRQRQPARRAKRAAGAGPWPLLGRLTVVAASVLLPIVLLAAIALGLLYVRLLNGPVSISFLKEPIERGISAELPGFNISIGDSVMALRGHSFEFRLRDVRLRNSLGKTVAIAPLAAVEVSRSAFLSGVISPSRIVLIEPRMLVFYSAETGVSLSIAGARPTADNRNQSAGLRPSVTSGAAQPATNTTTPADDQDTESRIDLAKTIASIAQRARQREHATSYLDKVGLRNAAVIVDHNGARTALRVPSAEFSLSHSDVSSVLTGNVTVASPRGAWSMALRAEESQATSQVRLVAAVKDLFPEAIADAVPGLAVLNKFRFPISAKADYVLSSNGDVLAGAFDVVLGAGKLQLPWLGSETPSLKAAKLRLLYRRGADHITVAPSTLHWEQSRITIGGIVKHRSLGPAGGAWDFALQSTDGQLSTSGTGEFTKIKRWTAKGTLLPAQGIINLDRVIAQAGGGSFAMDGVLYTGDAPGIVAEGRFSPMSARNFLGFWPTYLAADARRWAAKNIHAGQLLGGTFDLRLRSPTREQQRRGSTRSDYAMKLSAQLANVRYSANNLLPPMFAPNANISFKDDAVSVTIPQSAFILGDDRSVVVSDLQFETKDIFASSVDGVAQFEITGALSDGLEIAGGLGVMRSDLVAKMRDRLSGKVQGKFKVVQPFVRPQALPDPEVSGQINIVDGSAKKIWRGFDLKGSNVIVDVAPAGLTARGEMLLRGVPVKFGWQRRFALSEERQPPLTVKATLDDADRRQLGMRMNHIVKGPIEVDVTIPNRTSGPSPESAQVRVDLTTAGISIESLAWQKPVGRRAVAEFGVGEETAAGRRLNDIRIDGDDLAVRGTAQLDKSGLPVSFDVSDFSVDVITRLQIKGERRKGNIWRVSVRGQSFEGREFFRSLFSTGDADAKTTEEGEPGLDLDVRITNVLGYWDTSLRDVRVDLSKRDGKLIALNAFGKFKSGSTLESVVTKVDQQRKLVATSNDAGETFKLVGFYPNVSRGDLKATIDLQDAKGGIRGGVLGVRRFSVLGDQVVSEVLQSQRGRTKGRKPEPNRESIQFDWMRVPFVVGNGLFVTRDAELRGPVMGALLCGKADFNSRRLQVAGTYIPLQGLSSVIGSIPGIGNLLAGPKGEGIIGITFEVRGVMDRPEVLVNPLSAVTPGIFREVFQVACPQSRFIKGDGAAGKAATPSQPKIGEGWRSETFRSSD